MKKRATARKHKAPTSMGSRVARVAYVVSPIGQVESLIGAMANPESGIKFVLGIAKKAGQRISEVQSVLFDRVKWTADAAKDWLHEHGFTSSGKDEGATFWRFRQNDPKRYKEFRTVVPGTHANPADTYRSDAYRAGRAALRYGASQHGTVNLTPSITDKVEWGHAWGDFMRGWRDEQRVKENPTPGESIEAYDEHLVTTMDPEFQAASPEEQAAAMTVQDATENPMPLRSQLVHAVTEYDRKQEGKRGYNRYAIGHYLQAVDGVMEEVGKGYSVRSAITNNFTGPLADRLLRVVEEAPQTREEQIGPMMKEERNPERNGFDDPTPSGWGLTMGRAHAGDRIAGNLPGTDLIESPDRLRELARYIFDQNKEKWGFSDGHFTSFWTSYHLGYTDRIKEHLRKGNPAYSQIQGSDYSQARRRSWIQEWYETASGDARKRTAQLRKLRYQVSASGMGSQITPVGSVKMTLVDIRPGISGDEDLSDVPPPEGGVVRMNPDPMGSGGPMDTRKLLLIDVKFRKSAEGLGRIIGVARSQGWAEVEEAAKAKARKLHIRTAALEKHAASVASQNPESAGTAASPLTWPGKGIAYRDGIGTWWHAPLGTHRWTIAGKATARQLDAALSEGTLTARQSRNPESAAADLYKVIVKKGGHWVTEETNLSLQAASDIARLIQQGPGGYGSGTDAKVVPMGRRNPESAAADLYEEFHGQPPAETLEIVTEKSEHEWLTQLGQLVELKVQTVTNLDATFRFSKEAPELCSSEDGKQLYIEGGDQQIDLKALKMDGEKWVKDSMTIGVLYELTYRTKKGFHKFKTTDYFHKLGEESGVQPYLLYDPRNQLLSISGGQYRTKPEGIVN